MKLNAHGLPIIAPKKPVTKIEFNFSENRRHAIVTISEYRRWYAGQSVKSVTTIQ